MRTKLHKLQVLLLLDGSEVGNLAEPHREAEVARFPKSSRFGKSKGDGLAMKM